MAINDENDSLLGVRISSAPDNTEFSQSHRDPELICAYCLRAIFGCFRVCSACKYIMCESCWKKCRHSSIKDLLWATTRCVYRKEIGKTGWINTCKTCSDHRPHQKCPADCPGRQKYSTRIHASLPLVPIIQIPNVDGMDSCHCISCLSNLFSYRCGRTTDFAPCLALRGYPFEEVYLNSGSHTDLHVCRSCFSADYFSTLPMTVTLQAKKMMVLFRASPNVWEHDVRGGSLWYPIPLLLLENGQSLFELAVYHVGNAHQCHCRGHQCLMLSTSIFCCEALRRVSHEGFFHVICIPETAWGEYVCDLSSPEKIQAFPECKKLMKFHGIKKKHACIMLSSTGKLC